MSVWAGTSASVAVIVVMVVVFSKTVRFSVDPPPPDVMTGASSLSERTTKLAVSVAEEKAVVPPLLTVLATLPLVPEVRSPARNVKAVATVPP